MNVLGAGCPRDGAGGTPTTPASPTEAREAFVRCVFDQPPPRRDGSSFEAAMRLALRHDRMAFAVRGGRCESALETARAHDAATDTFARAWSDLLPRVQAGAPDDVTVEQSIRHVGNAYRAW
ncbi:MAG: hypothetical protein WCJ30_03955 [Deltaproteobacteria bacterium]